MKLPATPPDINKLFEEIVRQNRLPEILQLADRTESEPPYRHWDVIRHVTPRKGFSKEDLWTAIKLKRRATFRQVPLRDKKGNPFQYYITDEVLSLIHEIDFGAGRFIGMPDPITNPQTRDRYVINSLINEAITSSQLEGAVATVDVAKEMIRTGRTPRDRSERMILNNYRTMRRIIDIKDKPLSPELVLEIHRRVTEGTLANPDAEGRYRREDELIQVKDGEGNVYHDPPPANELEVRGQAMCDFANGKTPEQFIPPAVRAVILHFWLGYDHPFVDGNGRTARALFYWAMLHSGYWLFEFISISNILLQAPSKYARSFLHTETDDNDLNYFIIFQAKVIRRAIQALHEYIDRKTQELTAIEAQLRFLRLLNHRQEALITHALRHPNQAYSITSHRRSHGVAYDTARNDLLDLAKIGLLDKGKRGKAMTFEPARDIVARLKKLSAS